MPIRPEAKHRYPPEWPAVRLSILERAGYRCEWRDGKQRCRAQQYAVGYWDKRDGLWQWQPTCGNGPHDAAGQGLHWPDLTRLRFSEAREFAVESWVGQGQRPIVIVLTVGHLDHTPENCAPANLRAWCQRHHLAYDQQHHAHTAYATRRAARGTPDLFPELLLHPITRSPHA
jgi:hypothetical protein